MLAIIIPVGAAMIYLNNVFLPTKIKSSLINRLRQETNKQVTLETLNFNPFTGLALKNLVIYDENKTFLRLGEGSCTFLILPFFKKQLVISTIKIKNSEAFLERTPDGTLNIMNIPISTDIPEQKRKFQLFVNSVSVINSRLDFQDDTTNPPFKKSIENLNLTLNIFPTANFKIQAQAPGAPPVEISADGQMNIENQELNATVFIKNLSPREFAPYLKDTGLNFQEGLSDSIVKLHFKDKVLYMDLESQAEGILLSREDLAAKIDSNISVHLQYFTKERQTVVNGTMDIAEGSVKFGKLSHACKDVNGRLEFDLAQIRWSGLNFKYLDEVYQTSGTLTDFKKPAIVLDLYSDKIILKSDILVDGKTINLNSISGKYGASEFSVHGNLDASQPAKLRGDLTGGLDIDLEETKELLKKYGPNMDTIKPAGKVHADVKIEGNLNDIKTCSIQVSASGTDLSLLGLRPSEFSMNYTQDNGIGNVGPVHFSLYGGAVDASAEVNLSSPNQPYWISAEIKDIKIEKLKMDTEAREKNVSGVIQAQAKFNGFAGDPDKLTGTGNVSIKEGRLLEINLLKGLGALLFDRNSANVVFHEGDCVFEVKDKAVFLENIKMKSAIADLSGSLKIGFDTTLDGLLNVSVKDELVPLRGNVKDFIAGILDQVTRVVTIHISGTISEPRYKPRLAILDTLKPAVEDVLKGIKEAVPGTGE